MNPKRFLLSAFLATITISGAALASPACTTEPQSKWLSESAWRPAEPAWKSAQRMASATS